MSLRTMFWTSLIGVVVVIVIYFEALIAEIGVDLCSEA